MSVSPRSHLADLAPVVHGSISDAELARLGLERSAVLDFSVNTNPLGPSAAALAAAGAAAWSTYPDDTSTALRQALARRDGVSQRQVLVGNGSAELIWLVALAYLDPGAPSLVVGPTFGEYARAARVVGGAVVEHRAAPEADFAVNSSAVIERARSVHARLLFLGNPNNPTGRLLPVEELQEIARQLPDTLVVLDEAYRQLVDEPPATVALLPLGNVLLLRSLTKDYALPGLRLGYTLGPEPVCAALAAVRPPWSVNAVAQEAGLAALRDEAHLARARDEIRRARAYLSDQLAALGLRVLPSAANFLLVEVGNAAATRAALLHHGICVRDCASFGLPGHVRLGLRTLPDCHRLVDAWRQVLLSEDAPSPRPPSPPGGGGGRGRGGTVLMIQGTSSSVGKSVMVAGLCRILARRGYRVAPFKAQNMSLNAAVTADGGEIARSTFVQARAAGIEPTVDMNPILLKPEPGLRSQVVVRGKVQTSQPARDYFRGTLDLWPTVAESLDRLRQEYDVVVAEGAGGPAELNLRDRDVANMRVARYAQAGVVLVGDIDRGGVFAQLLGTIDLLPPEERALVRGLIVNRFRGDRSLFADGVRILEERSGRPVFGVVPWVRDLGLAEEDSVALDQRRRSDGADRPLRVVVVPLPWIANFDDFAPLERYRGVAVDYVDRPDQLAGADLIVLPGSKSTVADLRFLAERGLSDAIVRARANGTPILGICGGFQMLGREIRDPGHVESDRDRTPGLGLLPHVTEFSAEKRTCRVEARVCDAIGPFQAARGEIIAGYEIHHGRGFIPAPPAPAAVFQIHLRSGAPASDLDGALSPDGLVLGTYLHGLFENRALAHALVDWLRDRRDPLGATAPGFGDRAPGPGEAGAGTAAEAGLVSGFQPGAPSGSPTRAFQGQDSFHRRAGVEDGLADPDRALDRWADVLEASLDLPRLFAACGLG